MSISAAPWVPDARGARIVILGADGFIGSAATRVALDAGADVLAVCLRDAWRLREVDHPSLRSIRLEQWWAPTAVETLELALRGATALVHLAYAPPRDAAYAEHHEREVNMAGALRAARAAARGGARAVFASSADVYGPWHPGRVDEDTSLAPGTPYGRVKLETEDALLRAAPSPGSLVVLRIATTFGPGELGHRAIPAFIMAALAGRQAVIHGDGTDVRDYVFVGDVAGALITSALVPPGNAAVMNVGSGSGRSTMEVFEAVRRVLGGPAPRHEPSTRAPSRLVLDVSRATTVLGFDPRLTLEPLLREEAEWLARVATPGRS